MEKQLLEQLKRIKLLVLDFDGVLTDGYVYFRQDGMETVRCSRKDSLGTNMLQKAGIGVIVISKETNPVVAARCRKMNVDFFYGVGTGDQKLDILKRYLQEKKLSLEETPYMGDDINDLECLKAVGVSILVADGYSDCKAIANYITEQKGGEHAVREVCDLILKAKRMGGKK